MNLLCEVRAFHREVDGTCAGLNELSSIIIILNKFSNVEKSSY